MSQDGFITPNGEFIADEEVERMFAAVCETLSTRALGDMIIGLGRSCIAKGKNQLAQAYFEKALGVMDATQGKAYCLLSIGQLREKQDDLAGALVWYLQAFRMEPDNNACWYFLFNNTGFCLNALGRHSEAEEYCRRAISIDAGRHNAHKNLAVALEGLGQYAAAAQSYLIAAECCPKDPRALLHLEDLLRAQPEAVEQSRDFRIRLAACRSATRAPQN